MNFKVKEMCQLALAACLLALFSQIKIDLPGYVPLTLQTFMVYVIALAFKPNNAFAACFVYLCMGAIGLPVFSGFHGGISSLVSYTGGYLFAFPIMAYVISCSKHINRYGACFLGTFVCYAIGTGYFMLVSQMALMPSLMMCVIPFLPGDLVKIILAKKVAEKIKIRTENYA